MSLLGLLTTILLTLHLLCMNVSSAGPLLCLWLNRRRASDISQRAGLALAWSSCWLLVAGMTLGLLLGAIAWRFGERDYASILSVFQSKVHWGIAELACSLIWAGGYWAWLRYRKPQAAFARFCHATLAVLAATNLLYHFPPLMTVMTKTLSGELTIPGPVDASTYRELVFTPPVMAQSLHIWIASLAVSGVYLFWIARRFEEPWPVFRVGARVAFAATLMQIGSGVWLLLVTPPNRQSLLFGEDTWSTLLLIASLLGTFGLLQTLAAIAFGDTEKRLPHQAGVLMLGTVLCMSGVLYRLTA